MTTQQEKVPKPKLGLLELARQLGNVSQACQIMGYSRDTFYGRPAVLTDRQKEYIREELSEGVSQRELAKVLEVSRCKIQQVANAGG